MVEQGVPQIHGRQAIAVNAGNDRDSLDGVSICKENISPCDASLHRQTSQQMACYRHQMCEIRQRHRQMSPMLGDGNIQSPVRMQSTNQDKDRSHHKLDNTISLHQHKARNTGSHNPGHHQVVPWRHSDRGQLTAGPHMPHPICSTIADGVGHHNVGTVPQLMSSGAS
jgi:hypothetical protein